MANCIIMKKGQDSIKLPHKKGEIVFDRITLRATELSQKKGITSTKPLKILAVDYRSGEFLNGPFPEGTLVLDASGFNVYSGRVPYEDLKESAPLLIAYTNKAGKITEAEKFAYVGGREFGHEETTYTSSRVSPTEARLIIQMNRYMLSEDEDA